MRCKDTIHLICWYLEGKLSESVEGDVEEHLDKCPNCRLVLEAAITTLNQLFNRASNSETSSTTPAA